MNVIRLCSCTLKIYQTFFTKNQTKRFNIKYIHHVTSPCP